MVTPRSVALFTIWKRSVLSVCSFCMVFQTASVFYALPTPSFSSWKFFVENYVGRIHYWHMSVDEFLGHSLSTRDYLQSRKLGPWFLRYTLPRHTNTLSWLQLRSDHLLVCLCCSLWFGNTMLYHKILSESIIFASIGHILFLDNLISQQLFAW